MTLLCTLLHITGIRPGTLVGIPVGSVLLVLGPSPVSSDMSLVLFRDSVVHVYRSDLITCTVEEVVL